jgi:hypothetical protein
MESQKEMIEKINKTEEILEELRKDGKSRLLDSPEDIAAMQAMNETMEEVHRDSMQKQAASERAAAECWVCSIVDFAQ